MRVFHGNTANEAWLSAAEALVSDEADTVEGRGGTAREFLNAAFEITNPVQRWVFGREPAMNPAFAIAEVVWILLGRDDADFIKFWNPRLGHFAGNSDHFHGAYGNRLRRWFGVDQLARAADALSKNPQSRQVVLQIWDPRADLPGMDGAPSSPDIPCNLCSLLKIRSGKLQWFQVIRSNDIFLGTPHNFIQFMTLQEIVAGWLGIDVGNYVQMSDSLHLYTRDASTMKRRPEIEDAPNTDRLTETKERSLSLFSTLAAAMDEMRRPDCKPQQCLRLALEFDGPAAYQNMALVVAADAARRHGGEAEAQALMLACSNPAFRLLWRRWLERCRARTKAG